MTEKAYDAEGKLKGVSALRNLLIGAFLVLAFTAPFINDPELPAVAHVSCVVFLCSLSGYWLGMGQAGFAKRISIALMGTTFVGLIFSWGIASPRPPSGDFLIPMIFCWAITLVIGTVGFVLSLLFGKLKIVDRSQQVREALQFRVRDIMVWTAVVAVLLAIGRYLNSHFNFGSLLGQVLTLALIFSAVAVVEIWAMLGKRVSIGRVMTLACGLLTAAYFIDFVQGGSATWFWRTITIFSQLLIIVALYIIRQQGFRFVRSIEHADSNPDAKQMVFD